MTWGLDFDDGHRGPAQLGLFPNGCSRCGHTEWGARVEAYEGEVPIFVSPGIPVEWKCIVCDGFVCGDCVLCKPESESQAATLHPMFRREIYEVTYCSDGCRALNVMSQATTEPLAHDQDARAELCQCPECKAVMHVSYPRVEGCCSTLCADAYYVRGRRGSV